MTAETRVRRVKARRVLPLVFLTSLAVAASAQPAGQATDGVRLLLASLERALVSGDPADYITLLSPAADRSKGSSFAEANIAGGGTRAVIRERDRAALSDGSAGSGYRLVVDAFVEQGRRGRIQTWQLDVRALSAASDEWRIVDQQRLSLVEGLYRLTLNATRQYAVRNLALKAEDLLLTIPAGSAFAAESDEGITALVLRGRGTMRFSPAPKAERGQLKIFAGAETMETSFDWAFVRVNPAELESHATLNALAERPVDPRELARAEDVFDARAPHSYGLDLADLSDQSWSLLPGMGDFLVDVHTRRFSTLTYTRSAGDAEDISLFDRRRKKNIALYTSVAKLEARGRFYSEDDLVDYDVLDYNVDASFDPEREWVEGRARLKVRVRAHVMQTMSLRLAASLALRGVAADSFGRLLGLRVRDQDLIIVNFPEPVPRDTEFTLAVSYAGRLEPQQLDREAIALQRAAGQDLPQEGPVVLPEPRFIYSNRTYWYPQSTVSDYATATLKIAVAEGFNAVATGELTDGPTVLFQGTAGTPRQLYVFTAGDPVRYLGCIISRFTRAASLAQSIETVASANKRTHGLPRAPTRASRESVQLSVEANPRQVGRGRALSERLARIASFYGSLVGDIPYPSFTVALVESNLPGGHSPPYFAILNQPLPTTPFAWRNDPAYFDRFPDFFVAHELAHQWWGHAVGWKNYHEQWLSEGLAQYFAALYAEHDSGPEVFGDIVRHLRRFAVQFSAEGPVYLGYRLGHIQNQGRVFRSIVYNKGAAVMHMLRRLVGDEAFFRGLKRFYSEWRFTKAGTDDLRRAFEAESNRSLARFFEGWIYGSDLPALEFTYRVEQDNEARNVVLRFEQRGELFDLPVTVTLNYASGRQAEKVVPVGDRVTELRVPLAGQLRSVDVNRDQAALARIKRREELRPQRR